MTDYIELAKELRTDLLYAIEEASRTAVECGILDFHHRRGTQGKTGVFLFENGFIEVLRYFNSSGFAKSEIVAEFEDWSGDAILGVINAEEEDNEEEIERLRSLNVSDESALSQYAQDLLDAAESYGMIDTPEEILDVYLSNTDERKAGSKARSINEESGQVDWVKLIDEHEGELLDMMRTAQETAFAYGIESLARRAPDSEQVEEVLLHDDGTVEIFTRDENVLDADVFNGTAISIAEFPHWTSDSFEYELTDEEYEEFEENPEKWAEFADEFDLSREDYLSDRDIYQELLATRAAYADDSTGPSNPEFEELSRKHKDFWVRSLDAKKDWILLEITRAKEIALEHGYNAFVGREQNLDNVVEVILDERGKIKIIEHPANEKVPKVENGDAIAVVTYPYYKSDSFDKYDMILTPEERADFDEHPEKWDEILDELRTYSEYYLEQEGFSAEKDFNQCRRIYAD